MKKSIVLQFLSTSGGMRQENKKLASYRLTSSARVSRLESRVKPRNGDAIAPHETVSRLIVLRLSLASRVSRLASNRAMALPLRSEHTYYKQKCMKRIAS